jgi:geranylgeranyl pyrophosphate synthase
MNQIDVNIYTFLTQNIDKSLKPVVQYYINYPGKHIRAYLVLYGAAIGLQENKYSNSVKVNIQSLNKYLIKATSCLEIIHLASLIHDDIIDNSPTRRTQIAHHIANGIKTSLLTGDYLFAQSLKLANSLPSKCKKYIIQAIEDMTYGEFLEQVSYKDKTYRKKYWQIITKKTGSLFATSVIVGYLLVKGQKNIKQIYNWGLNFGKLYQIKDDIKDKEFPFTFK